MIDAIVIYDVRTDSPEGERRLRAVAKLCEGVGTRVQYSVFELRCEAAQLVTLRHHLQQTISPEDSVRIYRVPSGVLAQVEQLGVERTPPVPGSRIF